MFGLREEFHYLQCADCKSLWLHTPPSDLSMYYGDRYYSMSLRDDPTRSLAHQAIAAALVRAPPSWLDRVATRIDIRPRFARYLAGQNVRRNSRIADIGSGEGDLLRRMAKCGFTDLWGIDPFIGGDRDDGPIKLRRAYLEDIDESFDVVMFNHSLEHVSYPLATLRAAWDVLRPFGSVVVRLPVLGFAWEVYGSNWVALDPPRHLFVPSVDGFKILAQRAGFSVERVFFDSTSLQFRGSERYLKDIPLLAKDNDVPRSVLDFEHGHIAEWEERAQQLNREGRGDNAGFVLKIGED